MKLFRHNVLPFQSKVPCAADVCKYASIPAEDIEKDASFLGMTTEQFVSAYLDKEEYGMNYLSKHKPCDFLQENGDCKL